MLNVVTGYSNNNEILFRIDQKTRWWRFNPRPAGPSPAPTLWGGGGRSCPPSISETNRRGGKIQTAMERPRRDLSDKVLKFDLSVTCDVIGQVKHKMFDISI